MTKINLNQEEFTSDDEQAPEKKPAVEEEEVKEEEAEEETPAAPTEKETQPESSKGETKEEQDEKAKLAALDALRKEEESLGKNLSELDIEIETRRKRISDLRAQRRDKKDIVERIDTKIPEATEDNLADIDKDTLTLLDRYTKAKGLVPKQELEKISFETSRKNSEKAFFNTHKEYLPANDPDDSLFTALKAELSLYVQPTDPEQIAQLFERAHAEVKKKFPTRFKTPVATDTTAARERIKLQQMGSGGSGSGSQQKSSKAPLSARQKDELLRGGWTEEEISKM